MKKAFRRFLWLLPALLLVLCAAALAEPGDPVCVRVGEFSYPLSLVQQSLDSAVRLQEALGGEPMTEEEKAQLVSDIIDNMVGIGLIETKLTEAGQHDFTDEEVEQMNAAARSRYEELWQGVHRMMQENGQEATEEQVVQAMNAEGYTLDALYREYEVSERQRRAIALYVPPIAITEEELRDYYATRFLAPDRERYRDNIPLYEKEILAPGNESFYTPEGYRVFRQILLEYPEEVTEALKPALAKVESASEAVGDALAKLTGVVTETDDWSELDEPRAAYDAAVSALEAAGRQYADKRKELTMPLVQDTLEAIHQRLKAGIAFRDLIPKYSADTSEQNVRGKGYPLHPDSQGWPKEFIDAGMAMEKPGDVSQPVLTDKGVHILYYDSDLPAGDHVLTEEEEEMLKESALYDFQVQELMKQAESWKQDYDIETHPDLLKY